MRKTLFGLGFPPLFTGVGLVPYDCLSNYFRGTMGIFEDLMENEDNLLRAVNMFADLQIRNLQYFRFAQMPVKRVMFWMHKGMDGFMSEKQYEALYWQPFLKVIHALAVRLLPVFPGSTCAGHRSHPLPWGREEGTSRKAGHTI